MPSAPKWLFDLVDRLIPSYPKMKVVHTELLCPGVKRIRFGGDFRKSDLKIGRFMDFRVSDTEVRRYTISSMDEKKNSLEIVAHLHGNGPGSRFMELLKIGDKVNLYPIRGRRYDDKSIEKYVIFGDETSLALACSFQPVLLQNGHPFLFYFELDDQNRNVPDLLGLKNCTVFPKNGSFRNIDFINDLPVFQSTDWQDAGFVLTGNVRSVQGFRKVLKSRSFTKVNAHGYWLEGKKGL